MSQVKAYAALSNDADLIPIKLNVETQKKMT